MKIQIDSNGYFTGNYAIIGEIENGVEYNGEIPTENTTAYKLENGVLVFDENAVTEEPIPEMTDAERVQYLEEQLAALKIIMGVE